jgi:uroporphyrinogen decarboxylase
MNYIAKHNQKLLNETEIKLDFDSLSLYDWNIYPDGFRPKFIDNNTFVDHIGRIFRTKPEVNTTYWVDGIIKSIEDLENFEFPRIDQLNFDILEETLSRAKEEYPVMVFSHAAVTLPFEIRGGIDKLVYDIFREPTFARKLIEKAFKYQIDLIKKFIEYGVDIIVEGDDLADSKGPLFSPKILREFFFPYLKKIIEECKSNDVIVMKHTDGNVYPILDELVNFGIDGLHPMEPGVMDIGKVKKTYGERIFLRGNVDCIHILPYGTEDEVRADVRRCIDAGAKGGGFILSDSNSLHSNVKTENIKIMVDEARRYGKYDSGKLD